MVGGWSCVGHFGYFKAISKNMGRRAKQEDQWKRDDGVLDKD
jgi:hypothetical protein